MDQTLIFDNLGWIFSDSLEFLISSQQGTSKANGILRLSPIKEINRKASSIAAVHFKFEFEFFSNKFSINCKFIFHVTTALSTALLGLESYCSTSLKRSHHPNEVKTQSFPGTKCSLSLRLGTRYPSCIPGELKMAWLNVPAVILGWDRQINLV